MALPRTQNGRVLGRLPAQIPDRLREFSAYVVSPLPAAPAEVKVPAVDNWGMDGNDQYGLCVVDYAAHSIAAWDVLVSETDAIPTAAQCITQYDALTGCVTPGDDHDTGLVISSFLSEWATTGMFAGNKIAAFAPVAVSSITEIQQGIAAYGVVCIGVNLPQSAENQFEAAPTGTMPIWTYVGDAPIGGHCVALVGYEPSTGAQPGNFVGITWGSTVGISWTWLQHYLSEAYVVIPQAFVEAGKGPEVDLVELRADIGSLDLAVVPPKKKPKRPRRWWQTLVDCFR